MASVISSSPRGRRGDRANSLVDRAVEQVHADERKIAGRIGRLLDETHDVPGLVEFGDAEAVRIGNLLQQDLRGRRLVADACSLERVDERTEILLEQVVAEVHHEVVVAEELAGDEHAVGKAERRVLRDECEPCTEAGAVAERRHHLGAGVADDHSDLGDAGGDHRLDPVEQDRLVGDRHQLLGAGVGDRAQPGTGSAGENESLHDSRIVWRAG